MPTERFYRLSMEKRDIIRKAAIQEFKRVSPGEASINKIIQNADISRGSFYTYFEDKIDLLKWVMGDFIENYRQFYLDGLKENGGDLWELFDRVLDHTIQWVEEQGLIEIAGNMVRSNFFSEHLEQNQGEECRMEESNRNYAVKIYEHVNLNLCNLDLDEFVELLRLQSAALVWALKVYFTKQKDKNAIEASYCRCMKLLRDGACPKGNELK